MEKTEAQPKNNRKYKKNFASFKNGCIFAADLNAQMWIVDALFALGFNGLNEKEKQLQLWQRRIKTHACR